MGVILADQSVISRNMPKPSREGRGYRPEIDGLRALAVVPVVIFHSGFTLFSGGFTGVDIFFVISGFLIIRLLLIEADKTGRVSIAGFYARRVRRIAPALLSVLIATFVAGYFLLFPLQIVAFSKSALFAESFASNIWFWHQSGYFAAQGAIIPLLHTWSLAIEEQFYIFMPLMIGLLARKRAIINSITALLLVGSFALSWIGIEMSPGATFYLLPTRAWELLIGGALACGLVPAIRNRTFAEICSLAGLAAIMIAVFSFSDATPFPGPSALLPCLGAAAIIHGNSHVETTTGKLLAAPWIVRIGLISYSLYLWHWPVIIFARQYVGGELSTPWSVAAVLASFALAWISWRFIERPTRDPARVSTRALIIATLAVTALLAGIALIFIWEAGMPSRFPPAVTRLEAGSTTRSPIAQACEENSSRCRLGAANRDDFILIGDSHAGAIAEAVDYAARVSGMGGHLIHFNACAPLIDFVPDEGPPRDIAACATRNSSQFRSQLADPKISTVVLAAFWRHLVIARPIMIRADLDRTIAMIRRAGKRVIILEGMPDPGGNLPWQLALVSAFGHPTPTVLRIPSEFPMLASKYKDDQGVRFIDQGKGLCQNKVCPTEIDGVATFIDGNHISSVAAKVKLGPYFAKQNIFTIAPTLREGANIQ